MQCLRHKSQWLVTIISQNKPIHIVTVFNKMCFNIIILLTTRFFRVISSLQIFPTKHFMHFVSLPEIYLQAVLWQSWFTNGIPLGINPSKSSLPTQALWKPWTNKRKPRGTLQKVRWYINLQMFRIFYYKRKQHFYANRPMVNTKSFKVDVSWIENMDAVETRFCAAVLVYSTFWNMLQSCQLHDLRSL